MIMVAVEPFQSLIGEFRAGRQTAAPPSTPARGRSRARRDQLLDHPRAVVRKTLALLES